jgi:hypothetical protein
MEGVKNMVFYKHQKYGEGSSLPSRLLLGFFSIMK